MSLGPSKGARQDEGNGGVRGTRGQQEGARIHPPGSSEIEPVVQALCDLPASTLPESILSLEELSDLHASREFIQLLRSKSVDVRRIKAAIDYENELEKLQVELVKMQRWVQEEGRRVAILFEGRDAAGKGGSIRRFTEYLNPRAMRVVALPKPSDEETGQWYFQRYMRQLPNRGEIVFFDRSWYNRAVVEPVNGFCTQEQYERFMRQVPEFEHMLVEDGVVLVKFWFSISKGIQSARIEARRKNPLKQWKLSPLDGKAEALWDSYTRYKETMFGRTHTSFSPWMIVQANNKRKARLESIRYVLSILEYPGKQNAGASLVPDPNVVMRFHRAAPKVD
ncbi:polyphosphate kinase 2 [Polyangium sorediatum]|uniref:ADP/GDP-polyphosphate phosphotransferase n=1 Tax=Polyangium sorediatum TaxID=889274 RepID=A0ABT6NRB7_9BACT|nr:polyphosphate kinase 2 [Polyangium sorediatum]MDI1430860.1 polyphosphate kinase 2 [Polyangium sorediatum]